MSDVSISCPPAKRKGVATFRRRALAIGFLTICAVIVGGCGFGHAVTYRYKLTISVNTADGVKTGSVVCETKLTSLMANSEPYLQIYNCEAVYVDLGQGKRPLIALIGRVFGKFHGEWGRDFGPGVDYMLSLYGVIAEPLDTLRNAKTLSELRGPKPIDLDVLPDLVTFADVSDPHSIMIVDPKNLPVTLGDSVSWNTITLESTGEPFTRYIEKRLPWLIGGKIFDRSTLRAHFNPIWKKLNEFSFSYHRTFFE